MSIFSLNLNAGDSFWNEFEKERYKYITSNIDVLRKERSIANKILQEDLRAQKSKTSKETLVNTSKKENQVEEKVGFEEQKVSLNTQSSQSSTCQESQDSTIKLKDELRDVEENNQVDSTTTTAKSSKEMNEQPDDEHQTQIDNEKEKEKEKEEKDIRPMETKTSDDIKS
jgi:hypothetical protein